MSVVRSVGFFLLIFIAGCGGDSNSKSTVDLPQLKDITTAPAKIQQAAKAVVRIKTAGSTATGSFISGTGLLLTNNHVLGDTVCPREGCYVEITFLRQRGQQRQEPMTVFAVPQAVDVGLDTAVVQLYYNSGGPMLATPDYLTFNSQSPASLIGAHVTVVGHPEGRLKKWSDGTVYDANGSWFKSTAYVLPGNSGSPIVDDNGQVVGLVHRSPTSQDLFTSNGVDLYSVGTASAQIMAVMNAPLPTVMISVTAPTTAAKFVENDYVYLNAHSTSVVADGTTATPLTLLGTACDAALARQDFVSPDDLQEALTPCTHAQTWIDCRTDANSVPYGVMCPPASDLPTWAARFQKMNQLHTDMNEQMDYYAVSYAIARLQNSTTEGYSAGAQSLQQAMSTTQPVLDFTAAYYLSAFNIGSYSGTDLSSYLTNYKRVADYGQQSYYIALAADWHFYFASQRTELLSFLSKLYADPDTTIGSKLLIEDIQYDLGAL